MKLRELRESRGLSRYRLSKAANLDWGRLREAEDNGAGLRLDSLLRVADALDCSLDELCGRQWPKSA